MKSTMLKWYEQKAIDTKEVALIAANIERRKADDRTYRNVPDPDKVILAMKKNNWEALNKLRNALREIHAT
jgi:hypothetical protein